MVDTKTVEILARAKALVEKKWVRKAYREGDAYCAIGALEVAEGVIDSRYRGKMALQYPLYATLMKAMGKVDSSGKRPFIQVWNDASARTQQEVVCLFQTAIELVIEESE